MAVGGWHFKTLDTLIDKKIVTKESRDIWLELTQAFFSRIDLLEQIIDRI